MNRRPHTAGWATGLDPVPMRDSAEQAPAGARAGARVVHATDPIEVSVWLVLRQSGDYEAAGHAVAWTENQVHVRYIDKHGREGFAWVWANAVRRH